MRSFFEEESREKHFPGYFFGGEAKGIPFLRSFFEEESREKHFPGYFFGGEAKGIPF